MNSFVLNVALRELSNQLVTAGVVSHASAHPPLRQEQFLIKPALSFGFGFPPFGTSPIKNTVSVPWDYSEF
jgi:hypothetical protein